MGELEIGLHEEEGMTLGQLSDTGGPLEASGEFSISPEGAYSIELKLAARDKTQQNLVQALAMMGNADAAGRTTFKHSGQF